MSQQLLVSSSFIYLFNLCITQKEKMLIANLSHIFVPFHFIYGGHIWRRVKVIIILK